MVKCFLLDIEAFKLNLYFQKIQLYRESCIETLQACCSAHCERGNISHLKFNWTCKAREADWEDFIKAPEERNAIS